MNSSTKTYEKNINRHHATHLLVGSAESDTIVLRIEAVVRGVISIGTTIEGPMKGCLRFLVLVLVSGPARVCSKYFPLFIQRH